MEEVKDQNNKMKKESSDNSQESISSNLDKNVIDESSKGQQIKDSENIGNNRDFSCFNNIMILLGFLLAGFLSIYCILSFVSLADNDKVLAVASLLTGSLLAGTACAIASGSKINLPDYANGMKINFKKKKKRLHI
jgi:hypothetical protein